MHWTVADSKINDFPLDIIADCEYSVAFLEGGKFACCASGIEPENAVSLFVLGPMAMTVDYHLDVLKLSPDSRLNSQGRPSFGRMIHSDPDAVYINCIDLWYLMSDLWPVNVSIHSAETSESAKIVYELFACKISGMDDQISLR